MVLASLFSTTVVTPPPRDLAKRHRVRDEYESRAQKKECNELEAVRKASLIDKEAHQLRVLKVAAGESRSRIVEAERSTTDGAVIVEDTTDGVPTTKGAGSEKPDPSVC